MLDDSVNKFPCYGYMGVLKEILFLSPTSKPSQTTIFGSVGLGLLLIGRAQRYLKFPRSTANSYVHAVNLVT